MFRETCPDRGCLAVEFSSSGEVVHAYPYRLDELSEWEKIFESPRGTVHPLQSPETFQVPHSVRKYHNGDLLTVFTYRNSVPSKGGIARVDREGMPVWVRDDYSHHWSTVFMEADGEELALVPSMTVEDIPVESRLGRRVSGAEFDCDGLNEVDHLRVLSGDGSVLQDFRIIDKIIDSPFAAVLFHSTDPCELLHLNYIDRMREDVEGIFGVTPGDYVVSLRNISAFGIMDSETGSMKRLVRGSFIQQHSVQHLKGSQFLMFDNHGADADVGPSRILLVDLGGGSVREQTLYPLSNTPEEFRFYSGLRGNVSISQDRKRMMLASSDQSIGLEVMLADGSILNVFRNEHDLSGLKHNLEDAGDRAVYLVLQDLQYVE